MAVYQGARPRTAALPRLPLGQRTLDAPVLPRRRTRAAIRARRRPNRLGIVLGLLIILMNFVGNVWVAVPFLIGMGALAGFLVVPMNALLQHRGHLLMGAGHSIAVQNFNENISILVMNGIYASMVRGGMQIQGVTIAFGMIVTFSMLYLWRKHSHDQD